MTIIFESTKEKHDTKIKYFKNLAGSDAGAAAGAATAGTTGTAEEATIAGATDAGTGIITQPGGRNMGIIGG